MSPALCEAIEQLTRLVFEGSYLTARCGVLHMSANLSAIGETSRPVACWDVFRRIIGGTFCRQYSPAIADDFEPLDQYEVVAVEGGTESLAVRATRTYQQGFNLLAFEAPISPTHETS